MELTLDTKTIEGYRQFLAIKKLPAYSMRGRLAKFADEYATKVIDSASVRERELDYTPEAFLFDYQAAITEMALRKRKFAVFADCGLGKSLILLSYASYLRHKVKGKILILTPPLVVPQLIAEVARFWGDSFPVENPKAANLQEWLDSPGTAVGITNYEALKKTTQRGNLKVLILDEASILKSHYGNYAGICLRLGKGLKYKLTLTGTPAPNDRIEFANQAVFLDRFPTVNSFLATYFINRGQTENRWELKPHALRPFYRALSHWSIFLTNPATYGWKDNIAELPPIQTHIHEVPLTQDQRNWVGSHLGNLIATRAGGIQSRSSYGQVSKGFWKGRTFETNKHGFIADLIGNWKDTESTLVWCKYDKEQTSLECVLSDHMESMDGSTPMDWRWKMIDRFKSGETRTLISKPRILGFGLNLQAATRQVFSTLEDSYESYYQCVKRSNRIGSTKPLHVHIPITELEEPMVETVLRKADRVDADTREQEQMFKEASA